MAENGQLDVNKLIDQIIYANKKDEKKFVVNFMLGKNAQEVKLEAPSLSERNLWVNAIQLMITYYCKMENEQNNIARSLLEDNT